MRSLLKVSAQAALLFGLACASTLSIRIGYADYWFRQRTISSTTRAIAIVPGRSDYYSQLAAMESDENPQASLTALHHAVELNPFDARSWIELGLRYEADGEMKRAGECLLRAAEVDKQYLPRWTLVNYYLRRNDITEFWVWAKEAAGMVYGDPLPLLQLCGRVSEDGKLIDRLLIKRPDTRVSYLSYLLNQKRLDLVAQPVRYLLEGNRLEDVPVLLTVCDRFIEANRVPEALAIWNTLADAHSISFGRLSPEGGADLTNGSFALSPTSRGFDWRLPIVDGITAATEESPAGLRVMFSGDQPERCEPLVQFAPVRERTEYHLSSRYLTSSIKDGSGLAWRITDMNGVVLKDHPMVSSDTEIQTETSFVTPSGCRLVRLSLSYQRTPGTTRIDGFVALKSVDLKPSNQPR